MHTQINGKAISFNDSGWLKHRDDWSREVACEIAKNVGIEELTDDHWELIQIAREYYDEHKTCCPSRAFARILKDIYLDEQRNQDYVSTLFPEGGVLCSVNKIAGLPCPCDGSF